MRKRESVEEALEDWRAAERALDSGDRDADYGRLWSRVEEGRQGYERAISDEPENGTPVDAGDDVNGDAAAAD